MNALFQQAMKALFRHMAIELPPGGERTAYSVTVDDKQTINFFAAPSEYLNIVSDIGRLPDPVSSDFLRNVLCLNAFTFLYPELFFTQRKRSRNEPPRTAGPPAGASSWWTTTSIPPTS